MTKWTDFTVDERKAMIQTVSETKQLTSLLPKKTGG